jgi:taurine dioxygenase
MSTTTVTVTPTGGRLGASVTGVDLRDPSDDDVRRIIGLLDEHLVLVFAGQDLDDDGQFAFACRLGRPYTHPLARVAGREPRCEHIVDDVEHPPYQDIWHTDVSWDPEPPTYGTLRAVDLPSRGGDTIFASAYAAYDALSPTMQAMLEPLRAVHTMGVGTAFVTKAGPEAVAKARAAFPGAEHPVVGVHPATGRRYLYVNSGFTESIVGLHPAESEALLRVLVAHAANPNFQYRHHWRLGDVVVWDERCTQHFAVADYLPERREMGRAVVRVGS